jgi:hypothetical protein
MQDAVNAPFFRGRALTDLVDACWKQLSTTNASRRVSEDKKPPAVRAGGFCVESF